MFLDLLFPIKCYQCGSRGSYLCKNCLDEIRFLKKQKCPKCGRPSPKGLIHPRCQTRYAKLSGLFSLYSYHSIVGRIIRDYKYDPAEKIGSTLIKLTVRGLELNREIFSFWRKKKFIFLPVPLYPAKKLFRGFDQTAEILSQTAEELNLGYKDQLLIRQKRTKQQSKLTKKQRKKNVKGAFGLQTKRMVKKGNFVVFDDVWTTGSTIKAAASVLKAAGADQVWALTICG